MINCNYAQLDYKPDALQNYSYKGATVSLDVLQQDIPTFSPDPQRLITAVEGRCPPTLVGADTSLRYCAEQLSTCQKKLKETKNHSIRNKLVTLLQVAIAVALIVGGVMLGANLPITGGVVMGATWLCTGGAFLLGFMADEFYNFRGMPGTGPSFGGWIGERRLKMTTQQLQEMIPKALDKIKELNQSRLAEAIECYTGNSAQTTLSKLTAKSADMDQAKAQFEAVCAFYQKLIEQRPSNREVIT